MEFLKKIEGVFDSYGSGAPRAAIDGFNRLSILIYHPIEYEDCIEIKVERFMDGGYTTYFINIGSTDWDGSHHEIKYYRDLSNQAVIVTLMYWVTHQVTFLYSKETVAKLVALLQCL